jgi:hypothetical protein
MGLFGYDSVGDMFDGGGPGASSPDQNNISYDNDNDPTNEVTGIAAISNNLSGNSGANSGTGTGGGNDDRVTNTSTNTGSTNTGSTAIKGLKKTGGLINWTKLGLLSKGITYLAGARVDDLSETVNGREVYQAMNADGTPGMQYSMNFLRLPYEVVVVDGVVTDKLSIKDPVTGLTGYQTKAQTARDSGDNDTADRIMQDASDNAQDAGDGSGDGSGSGNTSDDVLAMAIKAGLIKNAADSAAIIANPTAFLFDRGLTMTDLVKSIDPLAAGTTLDNTNTAYGLGEDPSYTATTTGDGAVVDNPVQSDTATYDVATSTLTDKELMTGATGVVSDKALVDASKYTIDMTGAATGVNADGTKSVLGLALNDWASVDMSKVIDTSTTAGKLLADKLAREGKDFVDAKTSILWQMKTISAEFSDSNGNPVVPPWAQRLMRDSQKSIAFNGISGSAQTAVWANAIMESTLGVAEKEATFFQTLTTKNLDNKQEAIINKANVLSKLEMANLDANSVAAVTNAKNFMEMDLANLDNKQQAELINKQAMVQALFDNTKAINSQRLFTATSTNDANQFYSELLASVQRHNATEFNLLAKFNTGEVNAAASARAEMTNSRQKFLSEMQYNIDVANVKWRQTVETTNTLSINEAISMDIKSALDITQEAQNNIWDSTDSLLDYIWKTADNDMQREMQILVAQMKAQSEQSSGSSGGGFWDAVLKVGTEVAIDYFTS